ncbi:MAG: hypothetical protein DCC67_08985 [Planctomycetota bacterium]|nr:MAG: hypothetical protein DCC67_08985 [Planctomycetota bacterium]
MPKPRRVALLIDTSTSWGTRLIKGINLFAQQARNWLIHVEPRGRYEHLHIPHGWQGDGVIARINSPALAEEIAAAGLPAVDVSWYRYEGPRIARCTVDDQLTGRMAAEYFLSNGFRQFAYCGPIDRPGYHDGLAEAFSRSLGAAGYACRRYVQPPADAGPPPWDAHLSSLVEWLQSLPRATALLAWGATRGRQVTEACHYAGVPVPDHVAVLGGEYDDLMSNISTPPLSTVDQPAEQVGYAAAQLLERMMAGRKPPAEPVLFPPSRVVVRHSTDTLAVDDPLVREALELIRRKAASGMYVADVARALLVARRTLEQRFIRTIGRTPAAEIRRVRIEEAKRLLIESSCSVAQVARAAGFAQQDLFSRTFRRCVGASPSEFRKYHGGVWQTAAAASPLSDGGS